MHPTPTDPTGLGSAGRALLAALALLTAGCTTSPPTHFYLLAPTADSVDTDGPRPVIVAVGPVEVAAYLDRSQIVLREGPTRLALADFHQWAEPLGRNIARVIAANLHALLPPVHPIVQPWSDLPGDYKVAVKILRLDSDAQGRVRLRASWAIAEGKTRRYLEVHHTELAVPARSTDFGDVAWAMSEALGRLSAEIAAALRRHLPE